MKGARFEFSLEIFVGGAFYAEPQKGQPRHKTPSINSLPFGGTFAELCGLLRGPVYPRFTRVWAATDNFPGLHATAWALLGAGSPGKPR